MTDLSLMMSSMGIPDPSNCQVHSVTISADPSHNYAFVQFSSSVPALLADSINKVVQEFYHCADKPSYK